VAHGIESTPDSKEDRADECNESADGKTSVRESATDQGHPRMKRAPGDVGKREHVEGTHPAQDCHRASAMSLDVTSTDGAAADRREDQGQPAADHDAEDCLDRESLSCSSPPARRRRRALGA